MPNTKPILLGNIYRPPDQSGFLANLSNAIFNTPNFDNQEVYILGDFNVNLNYAGKPTRITKNTSTILDHILTNSLDKIFQVGTLDIGLSDHQLIYCTREKN